MARGADPYREAVPTAAAQPPFSMHSKTAGGGCAGATLIKAVVPQPSPKVAAPGPPSSIRSALSAG